MIQLETTGFIYHNLDGMPIWGVEDNCVNHVASVGNHSNQLPTAVLALQQHAETAGCVYISISMSDPYEGDEILPFVFT